MNLRDIPMGEIIPQQPPFVMVDHLLSFDEQETETSFLVTLDNLFCHEGSFSASGIIENMAQTCAARIGYYNKYVLHRDVMIGYIGAVKALKVHRNPAIGEEIRTRIEVLSEALGMTLVKAEVRGADNVICAECEMKIAIADTSAQPAS